MSTIADKLKLTKRVEVLVKIDFEGLVKRWGYRNLTVTDLVVDDQLFEGKLLQKVSVGSSYNFESQTTSLREIGFSIANDDRFHDEEVRRRLDGALGSVYIWTEGLTWANISPGGVLFKGVFRKKDHDKFNYNFSLAEQPLVQFGVIPEITIGEDNWPNLRTEGGGGSVAGLPHAIVYGDWPKGVPLKCVDTSAFKYVVMSGVSKSTDAEYTATTENVYDKDGAVVAAGGFTFYPSGFDGLGNVVSYFDFTGDQVASEPLSCSIRGELDSGGMITGTIGALIEHPADIILHNLKYRTRLDSVDVGVESVRSMKSLLPGLKFSSIVNAQANVLDVIDRILKQCCYARTQNGGKVSVVGIHTNGPVLYYGQRSGQVGNTVKISKTPDKNICNDLYVQYGLNPSTGKYEKELFRNRTNSDLCRKSFYQYGLRPQVLFKLPDVQDGVTAGILANRYVELFSFRHDIAIRETPIWEGWDVVEGDTGLLTIEEGPSADGLGWVDEKCVLVDRDIKGGTIVQRWWRVTS